MGTIAWKSKLPLKSQPTQFGIWSKLEANWSWRIPEFWSDIQTRRDRCQSVQFRYMFNIHGKIGISQINPTPFKMPYYALSITKSLVQNQKWIEPTWKGRWQVQMYTSTIQLRFFLFFWSSIEPLTLSLCPSCLTSKVKFSLSSFFTPYT